ncbi:hypothetical protein [Tychonema bourrellyi]|uniref:hypothetical protein n=1 Tax=Tychonema bourrellyi TaxID=54313 RepID=UPI001FE51D04|nr:hypothetical protein [Tychonema bourrellyi]
MPSTIEFPFSDDEALPTIPITLSHAGFSVSANALLDTGSAVNLLPYDIGLQLGAIWEEQTIRLPLAGNLARVEAHRFGLKTVKPIEFLQSIGVLL